MPQTCKFQEGGLKRQDQTAGRFFFHKICLYSGKSILYIMVWIFSYIITGYVFSTCIIPNNNNGTISVSLSDCISLGSIFATFGSAVIAVLSLTSSNQLSSFEKKLTVLMEQFATNKKAKWIRWEFLPRQSRTRVPKGKYEYYRLDNASLCFEVDSDKLNLPIPTVRKDFRDLPILFAWLKMYRYQSSYRIYVQKKECIADFLIWNCLFSMYQNIIVYLISEFFIWIGATFVINSIVYAFSYHWTVL